MNHIKIIYPNSNSPVTNDLLSFFKENLSCTVSISYFSDFNWEEVYCEGTFFIIFFDFYTMKDLVNSCIFEDNMALSKIFMISLDRRIITPEDMMGINFFGAAYYDFIANPVYSIKYFLGMSQFSNFDTKSLLKSNFGYNMIRFKKEPLKYICDYINNFINIYSKDIIFDNFEKINIKDIRIPLYYVYYIKEKGLIDLLENYITNFENTIDIYQKKLIIKEYIKFIYNNL